MHYFAASSTTSRVNVFTLLHLEGPFVRNWHLKAIAHELERTERGETTRLIINLPPRLGKSIACR
jgi:hypothetical protein